MKFLRTIRFDNSDTQVFEQAAPSGEWAVSGAFAFTSMPRLMLVGKTGPGMCKRVPWYRFLRPFNLRCRGRHGAARP